MAKKKRDKESSPKGTRKAFVVSILDDGRTHTVTQIQSSVEKAYGYSKGKSKLRVSRILRDLNEEGLLREDDGQYSLKKSSSKKEATSKKEKRARRKKETKEPVSKKKKVKKEKTEEEDLEDIV